MKKTVLILCVLALIIIAGCGEKTVVTPEAKMFEPRISDSVDTDSADSSAEVKESEQTQAVPEPVKKITKSLPELSSDVEEAVKQGITGPNRVVIRPPSQTAEIGDKLVYGYGIYNADTKERTFRVTQTEFVRAVDSNNNAILADKEIMRAWILTKFDDIVIPPYTTEILPIHLEVKDSIAAGKDVVPGTYEFEIIIFEASADFLRDKYGETSLFVRVD